MTSIEFKTLVRKIVKTIRSTRHKVSLTFKEYRNINLMTARLLLARRGAFYLTHHSKPSGIGMNVVATTHFLSLGASNENIVGLMELSRSDLEDRDIRLISYEVIQANKPIKRRKS